MNQKIKRELKDTWLCLTCGEKIIPFDKKNGAGLVEGGLFLIGLIFAIFVNLFFGLLLLGLSVVITLLRSSGAKKKICPSCESEQIVPSTSPAARKFAS